AYGALKLSATSRPVLKGDVRVEMRRLAARKLTRTKVRTASPPDLAPGAVGLLQRLKGWRSGVARTQGVPAYVILHDKTLAEIAQQRPADASALARIPGIGANKLARFGDALLKIAREG
ncbi:MAG TPA: HRDC domain-containing protein, partial [Casimicrobiaceae bacterium]|nr:HRDC domain-containing protein [Casimicrobiaceae bacterium]